MIILTAAEADQVRGPSRNDPTPSLEPIALKDGTFMLPEAVLADPAHIAHRDFLVGLPTVAVIDPALLPDDGDSQL